MRLPDDSTTPTREQLLESRGGALYLKSWLAERFVVGILGVAMPIILIVGDRLVFDDITFPRESLSAYYFSGFGDVFVGTLCVTGVFLVTYMAFHYNWDNVVSTVAGIAAILVALFPTGPEPPDAPTKLQLRLGLGNVQTIHTVSSYVFIAMLAVMSYRFARREGERNNSGHRAVHLVCSAVMVASAVVAFVAARFGVTHVDGLSGLLIVELISTYAFGISWLLKGAELSAALTGRGFYGPEAELRLVADPPRSGVGSPPGPDAAVGTSA
jgi:hypothetical protein